MALKRCIKRPKCSRVIVDMDLQTPQRIKELVVQRALQVSSLLYADLSNRFLSRDPAERAT